MNRSINKEIDLLEIVRIVWLKRKSIVKFSLLGIILGLIIAYSIPKTYTTKVSLAPDQSSNVNGSIGTIAAITGLNIGSSTSTILTSPDLFPEILTSTPFLKGLFDVKVLDEEQFIDTTLFIYVLNYQKSPWWSNITKFPMRILNWFTKNNTDIDVNNVPKKSSSYIVLSKNDDAVLNNLRNNLNIVVDKKTGIINLTVTMQSPTISASIASVITTYLQKYVINYRTLKYRENLDFTNKLYEETKNNYYKKQQELAIYIDSNTDVISAKFATTKERLQNETDLAYNIYNQMAQELQRTKIKVQDNTPVYTILEPAVEPVLPSSPNKKMIIISSFVIFTILGCFVVFLKSFLFNK